MKKFKAGRIVSFFTAACFIVTQLALPLPAWGEGVSPFSEVKVSNPFQLDLPPDLGTVQALHSGTGPALVHIQSAHGNYGAQKKIQALLHYLKDRYGIKTLFLEGGVSRLEPDRIRFFPKEMDLTMKILEDLTRDALLEGDDLFLVKEPEATGYGIEDLDTYLANGGAFRAVLTQQEKTEQFIRQMDLQIDRLTAPYLNKDLRSFLKRQEYFEKVGESGQSAFFEWLHFLKEGAKKHLEIDLGDPAYQIEWPNLVRIFKLEEFEKTIDLKAFVAERDKFLNVLRQLKTLDLKLKTLLSSPLSRHQLPDPETGILFEKMAAALPSDFDYKAYPNVQLFIGHLILQSEVKADGLVKESDSLTDLILEKLAKTDEEKKVLSLLKDHQLLKKLFALELTPEDYEKIVLSFKSQVLSSSDKTYNLKLITPIRPSHLIHRFLSINYSRRVRDLEFRHLDEVDLLFDKALEFYRGVKARDTFMLQSIESRLRETGQDKAVIVTGGFHAGPFQDFFSSRGYSYALVAPRIEKIESRDAYLKATLDWGAGPLSESTYRVPHVTDPKMMVPDPIRRRLSDRIAVHAGKERIPGGLFGKEEFGFSIGETAFILKEIRDGTAKFDVFERRKARAGVRTKNSLQIQLGKTEFFIDNRGSVSEISVQPNPSDPNSLEVWVKEASRKTLIKTQIPLTELGISNSPTVVFRRPQRGVPISVTPEMRDRIFDALEKKGMTRADLARKLNLTYSHLHGILRGKKNPSRLLLEDLAGELGINLGLPQPEERPRAEVRFIERILVVDDEPLLLNLTGLRLRQWQPTLALPPGQTRPPVKIDTAKNGQEAFDMIQSAIQRGEPYDVVLTDTEMPVMDGIHLVRNAQSLRPETIFVISTGNRSDHESPFNKLKEEHLIFDYLFKPYGSDDLYAILNKIDPLVRTEVRAPTNPFLTDVQEQVRQAGQILGKSPQEIADLIEPEHVYAHWLETSKPLTSGRKERFLAVRVQHRRPLGEDGKPERSQGGIRLILPEMLGKGLDDDNSAFYQAILVLKPYLTDDDQTNLNLLTRFTKKWIVDEAKALAMGMSFKNKVAGLPLGGGKGAIFLARWENIDGTWTLVPINNGKFEKKDLAVIMRDVARAFAKDGIIFETIDGGAPDVNPFKHQVGTSEMMGWLIDETLKYLIEHPLHPLWQAEPELLKILRATPDSLVETPYLDAAMAYALRTDRPLPVISRYTGKKVGQGGSLYRDKSTGEGAVMAAEALVRKLHPDRAESSRPLEGLRVAIQGFGNAAIFAAYRAVKQGAHIIALSDSGGAIIKEGDGFFTEEEIGKLVRLKGGTTEKKSVIDAVKTGDGDYHVSEAKILGEEGLGNARLLELPVDLLIPAALENQINESNMDQIKALIVSEAANGATTKEAMQKLFSKKTYVIPFILASPGGVAISSKEIEQNFTNRYLNEEELRGWLEKQMQFAVNAVWQMHEERKVDLGTAAFLVGIQRLTQGISPAPSRAEVRMLVLTRKPGEKLVIGAQAQVVVTVFEVRGNNVVKFSVRAAKSIPVFREEISQFSTSERTDLSDPTLGQSLEGDARWVLSRKAGESFIINGEVEIKLLELQGNKVKLGIQAPADIPILRGEIFGRKESPRSEVRSRRGKGTTKEIIQVLEASKPFSKEVNSAIGSAIQKIKDFKPLSAASLIRSIIREVTGDKHKFSHQGFYVQGLNDVLRLLEEAINLAEAPYDERVIKHDAVHNLFYEFYPRYGGDDTNSHQQLLNLARRHQPILEKLAGELERLENNRFAADYEYGDLLPQHPEVSPKVFADRLRERIQESLRRAEVRTGEVGSSKLDVRSETRDTKGPTFELRSSSFQLGAGGATRRAEVRASTLSKSEFQTLLRDRKVSLGDGQLRSEKWRSILAEDLIPESLRKGREVVVLHRDELKKSDEEDTARDIIKASSTLLEPSLWVVLVKEKGEVITRLYLADERENLKFNNLVIAFLETKKIRPRGFHSLSIFQQIRQFAQEADYEKIIAYVHPAYPRQGGYSRIEILQSLGFQPGRKSDRELVSGMDAQAKEFRKALTREEIDEIIAKRLVKKESLGPYGPSSIRMELNLSRSEMRSIDEGKVLKDLVAVAREKNPEARQRIRDLAQDHSASSDLRGLLNELRRSPSRFDAELPRLLKEDVIRILLRHLVTPRRAGAAQPSLKPVSEQRPESGPSRAEVRTQPSSDEELRNLLQKAVKDFERQLNRAYPKKAVRQGRIPRALQRTYDAQAYLGTLRKKILDLITDFVEGGEQSSLTVDISNRLNRAEGKATRKKDYSLDIANLLLTIGEFKLAPTIMVKESFRAEARRAIEQFQTRRPASIPLSKQVTAQLVRNELRILIEPFAKVPAVMEEISGYLGIGLRPAYAATQAVQVSAKSIVQETAGRGQETTVRVTDRFVNQRMTQELGRAFVSEKEAGKMAGDAELIYNLLKVLYSVREKGVQKPVVAFAVGDSDDFKSRVIRLLENKHSGITTEERLDEEHHHFQKMIELFKQGGLIEFVESSQVAAYAAQNASYGLAAFGFDEIIKGAINFSGLDETKLGVAEKDRKVLYPALIFDLVIAAKLTQGAGNDVARRYELLRKAILDGRIFAGAMMNRNGQRFEIDSVTHYIETLLAAEHFRRLISSAA